MQKPVPDNFVAETQERIVTVTEVLARMLREYDVKLHDEFLKLLDEVFMRRVGKMWNNKIPVGIVLKNQDRNIIQTWGAPGGISDGIHNIREQFR